MWYTIVRIAEWKGGIVMLPMLEIASVQTGDNRDIVMWIILAIAALLLVVVTGVLSVISKKKK